MLLVDRVPRHSNQVRGKAKLQITLELDQRLFTPELRWDEGRVPPSRIIIVTEDGDPHATADPHLQVSHGRRSVQTKGETLLGV